MKIVRPYAKVVPMPGLSLDEHGRHSEDALKRIEWAARISHRSEEDQSSDSWKRFVKSVVIDHGDWSVVEHVSVSVDILTDRGITHELVRHRLFSFTQESTRFVNYAKEKDGRLKNPPCFIYPRPDIECSRCLAEKPVWFNHPNWRHDEGTQCPYHPMWLSQISQGEVTYQGLLSEGWRPQEARSVLPNALASRIIMTGNLRNWRHFFIMRTTLEAHPQMRQITIPLLSEFKTTFPILFDDIEANQKQSNNLRLPR